MPQLYPFQAAGLEAGRALYAGRTDGVKRVSVVFVGPTGMGKTTLAGEAAKGRVDRGGRVVCLCHRRELVVQMAKRIESFGVSVGYLGQNTNAPVNVLSIQEILSTRRMPDCDFVIVDEAHHYVSAEWSMPVREYIKSGARIMGLTATPERGDGAGLGVSRGGVFDGIVVVAQPRDLIALNAENDTQGITPVEIIDPTGRVKAMAQHPYVAWETYAKERNVAIFAPNVKNAEAFAKEFADHGVEALVIHGELDTDIRDHILARFASGELRIVINVGVLTEGWDAPICDCIIVARKCGSFSLLRQIIGRGRRAKAGKKSCLYIDLADNITLHGHPDSDVDYDLDEGMSLAGSRNKSVERKCRVCGRVLTADIERATLEGRELIECPECKTKISQIELLVSEDVPLARMREDDQRRRIAKDTRVKALATMYEKEIRKGASGNKSVAEFAYRNIFRGGFPPTDVRVEAWRVAKQRAKGSDQ